MHGAWWKVAAVKHVLDPVSVAGVQYVDRSAFTGYVGEDAEEGPVRVVVVENEAGVV